MSRLTRDGTAEPVSRDQILRHVRGQRNTIFPVQLTTSRIGNLTRLIHIDDHTYIHTQRRKARTGETEPIIAAQKQESTNIHHKVTVRAIKSPCSLTSSDTIGKTWQQIKNAS